MVNLNLPSGAFSLCKDKANFLYKNILKITLAVLDSVASVLFKVKIQINKGSYTQNWFYKKNIN